MQEITRTQAMDYVRMFMDELGYRPQIEGVKVSEEFPDIEALDVWFYIPGVEHLQGFTVWIEEDGSLYGEW